MLKADSLVIDEQILDDMKDQGVTMILLFL